MHSCDSQTSLRQNPARVPAFLLPGLPGIVVAFCLVLAGCNDTPHKAETDEPLPVAAVKPERRNVPLLVESTGMTQAVRTADIVARVEGTLQKIAYEDGALVQEGDTLFVIDPTMYKAKRQQAEATLAAQKAVRNRAAVEYARNQKLYAERAASQATVVSWREQLSNAEAQVAAAQAALTQAGIELGYTVIKAPFTGRVSRHKVDVGNVISPQTGTLASIVSQDPVYASFTAPGGQHPAASEQLRRRQIHPLGTGRRRWALFHQGEARLHFPASGRLFRDARPARRFPQYGRQAASGPFRTGSGPHGA